MATATTFNVNTFDAIVLSVVVLSGIVAFFRGFVRELLSLGAWVGAAVVTLYLFPHSTEFMKNHIHGHQSAPVSAGIGALGTYIAALLVFSIINSIILRYIKTGAEVGILDNFLGLLFGILRGMFIVSLGSLIMFAAIDKNNPPEWLKKSYTQPYAENGANMLARVAPGYLHDIEGYVKQETDKAKQERDEDNNVIPDSGSQSRNLQQILHEPVPSTTYPNIRK